MLLQKICKIYQDQAISPGLDIYMEIDDKLETKTIFTLGRVCCQQECKCEWVFEDAADKNDRTYIPIDPSYINELKLGYDCSFELNRCMQYCRRRALVFSTFQLSEITTYSFHQNDFLSNLDFIKKLCDIIHTHKPQPGYNLYVRHTSNQGRKSKHEIEDMHIGRLCCGFFNNQLTFAINRCT